MKGYYVSCGYMGYVNGKYQLFETEEELLSLVDEKALQEALIPLSNKILKKAKEVFSNE